MICDNCQKNFQESYMVYDMKITKGKYLCYDCFGNALDKHIDNRLSLLDKLKVFVGKYFINIG